MIKLFFSLAISSIPMFVGYSYFTFSLITVMFVVVNFINFSIYNVKSSILLGILLIVSHTSIVTYANTMTNNEIVVVISEIFWAPLCLITILVVIFTMVSSGINKEIVINHSEQREESSIDHSSFFKWRLRAVEAGKVQVKRNGLTKLEIVITFILGLITNLAYDSLIEFSQRYLPL